MTPGNALQGMSTPNVAQPDLTNQYCVERNEVRNAFISVGQMRADADFPIAADFHIHQGMVDTGHRLTASKLSTRTTWPSPQSLPPPPRQRTRVQ